MQEQKATNSGERNQRLAVALTVALTLVVLFLSIVLIIQCVKIGVANNLKRKLDKAIAEYEQALADGKDDLDYYSSKDAQYNLWLEYQRDE